jgi:hypothetical protein
MIVNLDRIKELTLKQDYLEKNINKLGSEISKLQFAETTLKTQLGNCQHDLHGAIHNLQMEILDDVSAGNK